MVSTDAELESNEAQDTQDARLPAQGVFYITYSYRYERWSKSVKVNKVSLVTVGVKIGGASRSRH